MGPRESRYSAIMELELKNYAWYGVWGLLPYLDPLRGVRGIQTLKVTLEPKALSTIAQKILVQLDYILYCVPLYCIIWFHFIL